MTSATFDDHSREGAALSAHEAMKVLMEQAAQRAAA